MGEIDFVVWEGASKKTYGYWVHNIPAKVPEGTEGNYIYAKVVNGCFMPVCIGHGDLGKLADPEKHHQNSHIKRAGATHVHIRENHKEEDRIKEEQDLMARYREALNSVASDAMSEERHS